MAEKKFRWIDSDMHLAEPGDLWAEHMDPKYRDVYRTYTKTDNSFNSLLRAASDLRPVKEIPQAGVATLERPESENHTPIKEQHYVDFAPYVAPDGARILPDGQIRAMEREGIDAAILFPTVGGRGWREAPPDVSLALAKAYNSWLYDFCSYDPKRLKLNALVPLLDVEGGVAELRRAVTELGATGISPGSSRSDVYLDDPRFEPFWAEAERLDVALTFHGSFQLHLSERYRGREVFSHATGRGIEHALAFMELMFGGVFERHPNLRFVFLEAGATWVLYWLFRLEEEWEHYRREFPEVDRNVRMRPVDYWKRQCWSGVEIEEWTLPAVISTIGDDNLVISSDFPHFDSAFPHASESFTQLAGVSDESKRKIMFDNCQRLYKLYDL